MPLGHGRVGTVAVIPRVRVHQVTNQTKMWLRLMGYVYRDFTFNQHFLSGFCIWASGYSSQVKETGEEISNYHKAINVTEGCKEGAFGTRGETSWKAF